MTATTTNQGIVYPLGTDPLGETDLRIKALADYAEAMMSARGKAYRGAVQTLTTAVAAAVIFDTETAGDDPGALHSTSTNPTRFTAVTAGRYVGYAQVAFAANAVGYRTVEFRKNGTVVAQVRQVPVTGVPTLLQCFCDEVFTAGQYLEVFATQTSGGNLDVAAGVGVTWASMRKIGQV